MREISTKVNLNNIIRNAKNVLLLELKASLEPQSPLYGFVIQVFINCRLIVDWLFCGISCYFVTLLDAKYSNNTRAKFLFLMRQTFCMRVVTAQQPSRNNYKIKLKIDYNDGTKTKNAGISYARQSFNRAG